MAVFGTYYLNAPSLVSATSVYTDAALTTVAPDGWYGDGVVARILVGGVFALGAESCPTCSAECSPTGISYLGPRGRFYTDINVGSSSLDVGAVVVEVTLGAVNQPPLGFVFFLAGGSVYNKFSCQNFGLVSIASPTNYIYIGNSADDCGIVALGPVSVPAFDYNPVTDVYDNTGITYTLQATAPQLALTAGNPGKFVMVIPKSSPFSFSVGYIIISLCNVLPTEFDVVVNCPTNLPSFTSTSDYSTSVDACGAGTFEIYYVADVNGNTKAGGSLGLYDWVFYDSFGQTILPDGFYRSPSAGNGWFEVQDGVIISFGSCGSYPEWTIDYEVENAILGPCNATIVNLFLEISQPPFPSYVNVNPPTTGSVLVPEGITHIQLRAEYDNRFVSCGSQFKMVIERNGIIIASKTYTPIDGVYEYLDVDINLDDDAVIYGYITLA